MGLGTILFALSGLGLGNSTRCDAVIQGLHQLGYEIDLFTSGNGERYFAKDPRVRHLHRTEPLDYSATVFSPYLRNVGKLKKLLKQHRYEAVVMDSEYSIALLKRSFSGLVFGINNSDALVSLRLLRLPRSHFLHAAVELVDFLFHATVSDYVLSPRFSPQPKWKGNRLQVPPVVRDAEKNVTQRRTKTQPLRIAIVSGGSRYASRFDGIEELAKWKSIKVDVLGRTERSHGNLSYHPFTRSVETVKRADILVVNAGFSSLSEAVIYRKPCITIPLAGHAEQWANAAFIARHGLGIVATEEGWLAAVREMVRDLKSYRAAHDRFAASGSGAEIITTTIHEKLRQRLQRSSAGSGLDSLRG